MQADIFPLFPRFAEQLVLHSHSLATVVIDNFITNDFMRPRETELTMTGCLLPRTGVGAAAVTSFNHGY